MSDTKEIYLRDLPEEHRKHLANSLSTSANGMTSAVVDCGMEVLKHLSIINAAGIAGATAISNATDRMATSLPYFGWGMALAITCLCVSYLVGLFHSLMLHKKVTHVLIDAEPISHIMPTKVFYMTVGTTWLIAIASIFSFLVGLQKMTGAFW